MTGGERLHAHLEEVHAAGIKLTDDGARAVLTKSVRKLQTQLKGDRLVDKYLEAGVDPIKAARGRLVSPAQSKLTEADHKAAVRWLVDRGWLAPLQLGTKAVVYRFELGRPT